MNFNVYLPKDLAQRMNDTIELLHLNRNSAIRQAIEQWLSHRTSQTWSKDFFNFDAVEDVPDFTKYRSGLSHPNEDIL